MTDLCYLEAKYPFLCKPLDTSSNDVDAPLARSVELENPLFLGVRTEELAGKAEYAGL